ncbi:MAG: hypothetical protein IAE78_15005 [Myxococcus sp.]|nr:hypothetical protein [Myxococcus sp.]
MPLAAGVALLVVLSAPDAGTPLTTTAKLLADGNQALRMRDLDKAATLLGTCVELEPAHSECLLDLAVVLWKRSVSSRRDVDLEQAMVAYQRFLDVAPAADPRRARVREILGGRSVPPGPPVVPPPPPRRGAYYPPSEQIPLPPRVTVALKASKSIHVSTIAELQNDNPAAVDASLTDAATLKLTGRKRGVANLKLYDPDGSWHAMRVDVK